MSVLRILSRRLHVHRWGLIEGDGEGAHRTCRSCGAVKRISLGRPSTPHDSAPYASGNA